MNHHLRTQKRQHTLIARCVFVYTNFSSFISKDDLAFLQKGEKTAELVFFLEFELKISN